MDDQNDIEITPAQTEKLLQFQDLTGIEDIARCRELLEMQNWDLELAVQDALNIHDGPTYEHRSQEQQLPVVIANHGPAYRAIRQPPQGWVGWGYFLVMAPFHFLYSTFLSLVNFAFTLFRPDQRRMVTDPLGDVMRFIAAYEAKYGPEHPVFYQGTYSQALADAKKELKFLLVYLHGEDHQDTYDFCRTTLSNTEVIRYIDSTMLFWACSVSAAEGYRVSLALRENGYPFLAVIVLKDNRMTVVARFEGLIRPTELLARLRQVVTDNEGAILAAQADRHERNFTQTLRRQQDEAYEMSLKADQEKERLRREEESRRMAAENERRQGELVEQERRDQIKRLKIELADQVPDEPPADHPQCIRIGIKLPEGQRLERRFLRTHSLKYLYYFVFCHPSSPDNFEIVTNFPRRVLPCQPDEANPNPPTFAEVNMGKAENVFVHDLEA